MFGSAKKEAQQEIRSAQRIYKGPFKSFIVYASALFALLFIYATIFTISWHVIFSLYIGCNLVLIFILYPATKKSPINKFTLFDCIWIICSIAPTIYYLIEYEALAQRVGFVTDMDLAMGIMISLACVEACRRVLGMALPILVLVAFAYCIFGKHLPGIFGHKGYSLRRIFNLIYGYEGIYGIVTRTYSVYLVVFMILGSFLSKTKAGDAFINLSLSLLGKKRGGAAKASVLSSGLAGSIVGSGSANITLTGTFTIPMMKKTGFSPSTAAAVETVSSIGGHVMPPVMGAAAFLMAAYTGIPYTYIVAVSVVPALLLYLTIFASVHFLSMKDPKISAIEEDIPPFMQTLKKDAILLLPIVVLVVALILGFTPFRAGNIAILAVVVATILRRNPLSLKMIVEALSEAITRSLVVAATAGLMGILLACLLLPGIPLLFSSWVVALSQGYLLPAILLTIVASYILGMGMTVSAAYILIAIVSVPAMTELGVPMITAHLIIFWFSQYSNFSPPFCLGAFVASAIAEANPMTTGWKSVRLGIPFFVVPFLMIYTPLLGLNGITFRVVMTWVTSALSLIIFAALTRRFWLRRLRIWEMGVLGVAMILLITVPYYLNALGLALFLIVMIPMKLQQIREKKRMSPETTG